MRKITLKQNIKFKKVKKGSNPLQSKDKKVTIQLSRFSISKAKLDKKLKKKTKS